MNRLTSKGRTRRTLKNLFVYALVLAAVGAAVVFAAAGPAESRSERNAAPPVKAVASTSAAPMVGPAAPFVPTTFNVTRTDDPAQDGCATNGCSLREAITAANSNGNLTEVDTVSVPAGTYTITITPASDDLNTRGDLDIIEPVIIDGAGSGSTIIQAGASAAAGIDRVFDIRRTDAANVNLHVTFQDLTIRHGNTPGVATGGGGIRFDGLNPSNAQPNGSLTLTNCVITDNEASGDGAGVRAGSGNVTITNTTFSNNLTTDGDGGGIFFQTLAKTINITGSTFTNNTASDAGNNNDVFGNPFFGKGGAAHLGSSAQATIQTTTFTGNKAEKRGGALQLFAPTNISDTNFTNNTSGFSGGAIYHDLSPTEGASFDSSITRGIFKGNKADVNVDGSPNNSANQNSAGHGGAIFHDRDVLTVTACLFGGTTAGDANTAQNGGAIATSVNTGSSGELGTLNVRNSTISGNSTPGFGAGLLNGAGALDGTGDYALNEGRTVNLINVTISNNTANTDNAESGVGGGIARRAGTTTLQNTIVAGNFRVNNATRDDANGALAGSNSLVGDGTGMTGLTHGASGNIVGTGGSPVDARLGPLQQNGGITGQLTHALLGVSPALDAGSNTFSDGAGLTTDQRGTGFFRKLDAGDSDTTDEVDMGSYEAHPAVEDQADVITDEDTPLNVTIDIGDADPTAGIDTFTAVVSSVVPPTLFGNPAVSGSGSSRNLLFSPAANQFGSALTTVTVSDTYNSVLFSMTDTFTVTVLPVADLPSVTDATTDEDVQTTSGLVVTRNVVDGPEVSHFKITNIQNGTLYKNDGVTAIANNSFITFAEANAGLKFTPDANEFTPNSTFGFDVAGATSSAGAGLGPAAHATITVNPVADLPSVTNATTFVNLQTSSGLVVSRNAVDGAEVTHFKITNIQNGTLFKNDGVTQINNGDFITFAEANAGLKFTPDTDESSPGSTFSFDVAGAVNATGTGLGPAATATITVNKYDTSTQITLDDPDPSLLGASVTVNFTVSNTSAASPAPDGTVVVTVSGGAETCSGPVTGGSGTCNITLTVAGIRTLTATFQETAVFKTSLDTELHEVIDPPDITVRDATQAEPATGSANMVFTVTLSNSTTQTVSVDFTTAVGGPNPASDAGCGGGGDYTPTNGTVTFQPGETVKTINVPICSDAVADDGETLLVQLSNPVNGDLLDGEATGTITANTPGALLISEIRTSGPAGAGDDFVEIYNNSNTTHTVPAGGYGLYKMNAVCTSGVGQNASPILIGTIPAGTPIPPHGHYLFVGSAYSLANYGGGAQANGNATLTSDIEDDRNVGLFSTTDLASISSVNRLDAVGFGLNTGGVCDLLREGSTLQVSGITNTEHSFVRRLPGGCTGGITGAKCGGSTLDFGANQAGSLSLLQNTAGPATSYPQDTNDNSSDFLLVETNPTVTTDPLRRLGAPGPENMGSPLHDDARQISTPNTFPCVASTASPNRIRDASVAAQGTNKAYGTLEIRKTFVNNTGSPISRLRFRLMDITTFPSYPASTAVGAPGVAACSGSTCVADMRALDSTTLSNVASPCGGTVTLDGTFVEQTVVGQQPNGGGYNSSLSVTLGTPLQSGNSVNVRWLLGVQQNGKFRFFVTVEALQ
jgi:CSLREA domain-containing protein